LQVFVIATPIGNLQDITLRALETLKTANVIVCEDTRVTHKLLSFHQIPSKPLIRLKENPNWVRAFAERNAASNVALVTDGGTPVISDPGSRFIAMLLQEFPTARIIPIPGPSAVIAALSISGLATKGFTFLGFLGRSESKIVKEISRALESKMAVVFYESPHRLLTTIAIIAKHFPQTQVVACRELTKIYEEALRGKPQDVLAQLSSKKEILGEITVVLETIQTIQSDENRN